MSGNERPLYAPSNRSMTLQRSSDMPTTLADRIRQFQRTHADNRRCCDCGDIGPTYICMDLGTFICTTCAGLHREINHRVKGISISSWNQEEVEKLLLLGNLNDKDIFLKFYNAHEFPAPLPGQIDALRQWIRAKYIEKRWTNEGHASRLPGRKAVDGTAKKSGHTRVKRCNGARSNLSSPSSGAPSPVSTKKYVDDLLDGFSSTQSLSVQPQSSKSQASFPNVSPFGEPLIDPFAAWSKPKITTPFVTAQESRPNATPQFDECPWNLNAAPDSTPPCWLNFKDSNGLAVASTWLKQPSSTIAAHTPAGTQSNQASLLDSVGDPWNLSCEPPIDAAKLYPDTVGLFGSAEIDGAKVEKISKEDSLRNRETFLAAPDNFAELKRNPVVPLVPSTAPLVVDHSSRNFTNMLGVSLSPNGTVASGDPFAELCDDVAPENSARNKDSPSASATLVGGADQFLDASWLQTSKQSSQCQQQGVFQPTVVPQPPDISRVGASHPGASIDISQKLNSSLSLNSPSNSGSIGSLAPTGLSELNSRQATAPFSRSDPLESSLIGPLNATHGLDLTFASESPIGEPGESTFQEIRLSQNNVDQNLKEHDRSSDPLPGEINKPHNEAPWSLKPLDDEFSWADFNTVPPFADVGLTADQMHNNPFCIN